MSNDKHQENRLSLVVPIYNEEQNIPLFYEKLMKLSYTWEAIMVDDGSTDRSMQELEKLAASDTRVKVIRLRRNYGQTAAMAAGFEHATGDIVIPLDADLQNDPADIPQLLDKIAEGYDVVSGWRKNRWRKNTLSRRLPSMLANALISGVTGVRLHDYGCTLKAYRREILKDVRLYGEMHRFVPAFAAWQGARVTEVVVTDHERQFGTTKYGMGRILRVMLDLITVKFLIGYSTKPMHFFGRAGLASFVVSGIATIIAVYWKVTGEKSFIQTPMPLFAALFFIVGVQFFLMGLVAEMMTRNYYENSGKPIYNIKTKINF